jgi:hypothetical protein
MFRNRLTLGFALGGLLALVVAACAPVDAPVTGPSYKPATIDPGPALTPVAVPDQLQQRILLAINNVRSRTLRTDNGFWTVFHGILGLGPTLPLYDPDRKEKVNGLDYICNGGRIRGMNFVVKDGKYLDVEGGEMFVAQGHQDQFIAEMAQWNMPADRCFTINGKDYTFQNFIDWCQLRASTKEMPPQELSWAIVIIGQYKGTNVRWKNNRGEELTYEDVVRHELDADVLHAACGGTHRLFGLTWAYHLHLQNGGKKEGIWLDVEKKIANYMQQAHKDQNPDGSFSTEFFRGKASAADPQLRLNTSGHIFEWLSLAMTAGELRQGWMQDAANRLALMIFDIQNSPMEGGTLYHAVHGLLMYYARVYNTKDLDPNLPHMVLLPKG